MDGGGEYPLVLSGGRGGGEVSSVQALSGLVSVLDSVYVSIIILIIILSSDSHMKLEWVTPTGLKVVGEVQKVGKSRNFQPKVGKSRNFSAFKVGKSRNFISVFIIVLSNMLVSFVVFEANHLFL